VLAAVEKKGTALIYASEDLRGDREIVLAAVQQFGSALQCASEELRNDEEFVNELRRQECLDERYVSDRIREEMKKDKNYLFHFVANRTQKRSESSEKV
jgi:hypothetical protein